MNNKTKESNNRKKIILVISIVALVAILIGASFLYQKHFSKPQLSSLKLLDDDKRIEAPDFTIYDIDGNEVRLSDYKGTPVILNFWASWCPPCKVEMPYFQEQYEATLDEDIVFLMVNTIGFRGETVDSATKFMEDEGYTLPIVYDMNLDAAARYGVSGIPVTYFINSDGMIISGVGASIPEEMLIDGITALLNDM